MFKWLLVQVFFFFFQIIGLQASQLVLSMRTAWVRLYNGEVARRYGITEKNPAGDYWKKIPGLVSWLAGERLESVSDHVYLHT